MNDYGTLISCCALLLQYIPPFAKVKEIAEIVYYIAFIIFTSIIVIVSVKTYFLQAGKHHKLLCKIAILNSRNSITEFGIELFNHGNEVAKDIKISIAGQNQFGCDFIKPNESVIFPVGLAFHLRDENNKHVTQIGLLGEYPKELQPNCLLDVDLFLDGKHETHKLRTELLSFYQSSNDGFDKIARAIDSIAQKGVIFKC